MMFPRASPRQRSRILQSRSVRIISGWKSRSQFKEKLLSLYLSGRNLETRALNSLTGMDSAHLCPLLLKVATTPLIRTTDIRSSSGSHYLQLRAGGVS